VFMGLHKEYDGVWQLMGATAILGVAGFLSNALSLGLSPDFIGSPMVSGPAYIALPIYVLNAYFSVYGIGLMVSALAIGVASAIQAERWTHTALPKESQPIIP